MGSGSGGYFRSDPNEIKKMLNDSENSTKNTTYETDVAADLSNLLSNLNDRDVEATSAHLTEIKKALEKDIEGTVDLLFGGSVAKHTYVDGLSDIDSLVILNNTELSGKNPNEVKSYFAERLQERFPNTEIRIGNLAVTVIFKDAEVQLLPAVKFDQTIKIPNSSGDKWSNINPQAFTKKLSMTNSGIGRKVIPTIKLAKVAISNLPQKHQISGYHTESLAVKIFKNYDGEQTPKSMLKHFFSEASKIVKSPVVDSTGQSVHVDSYLGEKNSLERKIVSDAFSRVYRRLNNADTSQSVDEWKKIFY